MLNVDQMARQLAGTQVHRFRMIRGQADRTYFYNRRVARRQVRRAVAQDTRRAVREALAA